MALDEGTPFHLYVTHLEGEGPNLKVFGQIDKQKAMTIEKLLAASKLNLENGLGAASPANIHVDLLVVAKYADGNYYRAKVINNRDIASGFVSVYFIDYGNTEKIHISAVRFLNNFPDVFLNTPPQARDFLLARIAHPNGVWEIEMQQHLSKLIFYEEVSCVVEMVAFEKYFIKMFYKGQDLSDILTSKNIGIKTTVEEQRNLLHKVLYNTKNMHQAANRMYVPPPARLANVMAEAGGNREAFRGYVPPQTQTTMAEAGRTLGKFSPQGRIKVKTVAPPRPLHRASDESPSVPIQSQPPATYRSRQLNENETYLVHVSYAKDGPKCFAIQLKSDEEFLSNIMSSINNIENYPLLPLSGPPMLGSPCLARFSEDKTLCRAVVLSSTESNCKLFFVDFGITENVLYTDIFQISDHDVRPDVFALRFSLSGITKVEVTEKIKSDFYNIVNNQVLTLRVVPPEGPPLIQYCELYVNGQCVKEMLLQRQNPSLKKIDPLSIVGENSVLVSYVDSCTKFFIQLSNNIDALNGVMDKVAAHCQETQSLKYHQVRCGMSCCAIFPDDQSWYRAIVTNIKKDKITVNYVDYGNEQEVTCDMLRPINPDLVTLNAQAVHCALNGFEDKPFDQRTCDSLEQLTLEKILSMNVLRVMEGDVLLVDLHDQSTDPPTNIVTAVHQIAAKLPSTAQDSYVSVQRPEPEATSATQRKNHYGEENLHENSFGSSKGSNDSYPTHPRKPYQDRGDRNKGSQGFGRGLREDRGRDSGKTNKSKFKGNNHFKHDGSHSSSEGGSQTSNQYRKHFADNTSYGGAKSHGHHQRDTKSDWSNKPKSDRGRNFSDRSSDKEYNGDKRSYGGDRQSKPFKPRSYEAQEPPKILQNPVPFNTSFTEQNLVCSEEYAVAITWFINPNDFFVTLSSEEENFRNMMANVSSLYKGVKPVFSYEVSEGSSVLAKFSEDKALYRAQIVDTSFGGKLKVQFVDYGNKCMVDSSDIWQLESDLMTMPKMAIPCSLSGVSPVDNEWKQNAEIDKCFSLGSYKAVFHSKENNRYFITLSNDELGDVQKILVEKQLAVSTEKSAGPPANATKAYVTHVDTPGQFWLQSESDSEKIDALQEVLQTADGFEDNSETEVGKLCIAKYSADEQFYRATILDADNDIITVRFIDYGNTDVLDNTPGVLKCLPSEIVDVEPYALKCSVNAIPTGTGQWTEQASEIFTSLLGDTEEPIDAVFILKGTTTYVDLFVNNINVTDQLVSQGLAVRSEKSDKMPTCFASHINSPSEFWIQLESSVHELEAISEELANAEDFPPLNEIAEEVICAAKFPEDDCWYRAQVIIHGSDGTEVLFMDYGNASLTNDLRSLPDHLKALPALSRKCALQKSTNIKNWSKESELKFMELAAEGATVFEVSFIASGDTSIVELYSPDGESVTQQLSALCQVEPSSQLSSPIRLPVIGSDDTSLPVYICHSHSPEDFWVQYSSSTDNLNIITSAMEHAANFQVLEEFIEGKICASIFPEDNLYYRSKVISHGESGTEVLHIDFGSTAVTNDLRELPDELISLPGLAKHCTLQILHDRSKMNEELHQKFAEIASDDTTEYNIEIIDTESDPMVVKLYLEGNDVAEILGYKYESDVQNISNDKCDTANSYSEVESITNLESVSVSTEMSNSKELENVESRTVIATLSVVASETSQFTSDIESKETSNSKELENVESRTVIETLSAIASETSQFTSDIESKETSNSKELENVESRTVIETLSAIASETSQFTSDVETKETSNSVELKCVEHEMIETLPVVAHETSQFIKEEVDNLENVISDKIPTETSNNESSVSHAIDEECESKEKVDQVISDANDGSEVSEEIAINENTKQECSEISQGRNEYVDTDIESGEISKPEESNNSSESTKDEDSHQVEDELSDDNPEFQNAEDEDNYSDISCTSEPLDPAAEIKFCLDACDNLQDSNETKKVIMDNINNIAEDDKCKSNDVENNIIEDSKNPKPTSNTDSDTSIGDKCVENNNPAVTN